MNRAGNYSCPDFFKQKQNNPKDGLRQRSNYSVSIFNQLDKLPIVAKKRHF
jgi:hypothetical protein